MKTIVSEALAAIGFIGSCAAFLYMPYWLPDYLNWCMELFGR